jgi:hypothetical protein
VLERFSDQPVRHRGRWTSVLPASSIANDPTLSDKDREILYAPARRRLGKKVVPYRLEPEVDAVVWAIATIEKTSKSAALKKSNNESKF